MGLNVRTVPAIPRVRQRRFKKLAKLERSVRSEKEQAELEELVRERRDRDFLLLNRRDRRRVSRATPLKRGRTVLKHVLSDDQAVKLAGSMPPRVDEFGVARQWMDPQARRRARERRRAVAALDAE